MRKWFGTDGIRGVANTPPVTVETAVALGRALARQTTDRSYARIVVGRDTRASGAMLEAALVAGIASAGGTAWRLGVLPTPAVARLAVAWEASYGVVISASHNPFADNGLKLFRPDGFKLTDAEEEQIEAQMQDALNARNVFRGEPGQVRELPDAVERYAEEVAAAFPESFRLDGLRVVLDCANGASHLSAPRILAAAGADVLAIAAEPDGRNINEGCGALHPELVAAAVREHGADLGMALDGDGDRVVLVDEHGDVLDGDQMMLICATQMLRAGTLRGETLVTTSMSNLGLEIAIREAGGRVVRTDVGDRYVVAEMRRGGFNFGGEQSGHLVFLDRATTGDGTLAALCVLEAMKAVGLPLSALARRMTRLPQTLVSFPVREKPPFESLDAVSRAISRAETTLGDDGRVVVRYSGTEPKVRVMVEGRDRAEIDQLAGAVSDALQATIGV